MGINPKKLTTHVPKQLKIAFKNKKFTFDLLVLLIPSPKLLALGC